MKAKTRVNFLIKCADRDRRRLGDRPDRNCRGHALIGGFRPRSNCQRRCVPVAGEFRASEAVI